MDPMCEKKGYMNLWRERYFGSVLGKLWGLIRVMDTFRKL